MEFPSSNFDLASNSGAIQVIFFQNTGHGKRQWPLHKGQLQRTAETELGCAATVHGKRLTALDGSASSVGECSWRETDLLPFSRQGILNDQLRQNAEYLNRERAV